VLEFDIKGAFDALDHGLLMRALKKHTNCKWVQLYVERCCKPLRWTRCRTEATGSRDTAGWSRQSVADDLFMHYAFDRWIRSKMPQCRFARYADDAVVHCQTEQQARDLKDQLAERLIACGLQLHPDKTRIVYCRDSNRRGDYPVTQFTFLGFTFRPARR